MWIVGGRGKIFVWIRIGGIKKDSVVHAHILLNPFLFIWIRIIKDLIGWSRTHSHPIKSFSFYLNQDY